MNFTEHNSGQIHEDIGQFINNNGMQLDLDQQINEIVRESFKTTKKYIWKGVFCFLFYFAALYTLKDGVLPIMAQTFPGTESNTTNVTAETKSVTVTGASLEISLEQGNLVSSEDGENTSSTVENQTGETIQGEGEEQTAVVQTVDEEISKVIKEEDEPEPTDFEMSLDLEKHGYTPSVFHVLFPIFGVAYHTQLQTVHNKKQHLIFHILQIAVFIGFLGVILATWAGLDLLIATGASLILVPIVSIIYSYTIFHMKCMATGRMARNAQDGENEDPNNRQRLADAADLDERQEVAIREFQERHQNVQVNFDR